MAVIFALTTFLAAGLLFWSEPMLTRQVLPLLGGSPGVWNTCVFLFQTLMLAGYAWAHLLTRLSSRPLQVALHLGVVGAGLFFPLKLGGTPDPERPISWLLAVMLSGAGVPFFALGATSPLLQRWFSMASSANPYRLYVASNLGSFLALLAFPLLLEPLFSLASQRVGWRAGYVLYALLMGGCAWLLVKRGRPVETLEAEPAEKLTWPRRLRWLLLAAAPSSLVLGTTAQLSTDIASVPLLWVLPLAVYLLTFVLAFGSGGGGVQRLWPFFVLLALVELFVVSFGWRDSVLLPVILSLMVLFLAARLCHGEMAADKPSPARLTEFYLWMSLGGALGGFFNGVLAPLVFDSLAEYPLALLACVALAPGRTMSRRFLVGAGALGALLLGAWFLVRPMGGESGFVLKALLTYALPILAWVAGWRLRRLPLVAFVAGPVLVMSVVLGLVRQVHLQERSFFGVHTVLANTFEGERLHGLVHGGTMHGLQRRVEDDRRREPLLYYHPSGPVGGVFELLEGRGKNLDAGFVGLGVGAMASYGREGDRFTFYEIDPLVARLASDPQVFSFLSDSKAAVDVVLGDARLTLERGERKHDLLVLDAFSSDSIPVHLLTREAFERAYRPRLSEDGWMLVHISNRYLQLDPVVAGLSPGSMDVWLAADEVDDKDAYKNASTWMLLTPKGAEVALDGKGAWRRHQGPSIVWTDDFSSLFSVLKRL